MSFAFWIILLSFIFPAIFKAIIKRVGSNNTKGLNHVENNPFKNFAGSIITKKI